MTATSRAVTNVAACTDMYQRLRKSDVCASTCMLHPARHNHLLTAPLAIQPLDGTLFERGYTAICVHGSMLLPYLDAAYHVFRAGRTVLLVATDVAARGLDIPAVDHVIQFDFLALAVEYLYEARRTARVGGF